MMQAKRLYDQLEKDFIKPSFRDEWAERMQSIKKFLTENFKRRSMGLVCDNTREIHKVYTAVFPSNKVMKTILDTNETDIMLFVHHPMVWDIRKAPQVFSPMDRGLLGRFRDRRISIYNLHVPLDHYGEYSTGVTLAKALGLEPQKPFAPYFGSLAGLFAATELKTVMELKERFESLIGHRSRLYRYGTNDVMNGMMAIIPGGGSQVEWLEEIDKEGVNLYLSGATLMNDYSRGFHEFAQAHKINILGGTHYSTEKFACIAMCDYFRKLGLASEFIVDEPILEDM